MRKKTKKDINDRKNDVKAFWQKWGKDILWCAKVAALFGAGTFVGMKIENRSLNRDLKKSIPDIIAGSGFTGMMSYGKWIDKYVPDAGVAIGKFAEENPKFSGELFDIFFDQPNILKAFMTVGQDPDEYDMRRLTGSKWYLNALSRQLD